MKGNYAKQQKHKFIFQSNFALTNLFNSSEIHPSLSSSARGYRIFVHFVKIKVSFRVNRSTLQLFSKKYKTEIPFEIKHFASFFLEFEHTNHIFPKSCKTLLRLGTPWSTTDTVFFESWIIFVFLNFTVPRRFSERFFSEVENSDRWSTILLEMWSHRSFSSIWVFVRKPFENIDF